MFLSDPPPASNSPPSNLHFTKHPHLDFQDSWATLWTITATRDWGPTTSELCFTAFLSCTPVTIAHEGIVICHQYIPFSRGIVGLKL